MFCHFTACFPNRLSTHACRRMSALAAVQVRTNSRSVQNGFSLIELMVAVAIVGILAAVALPSYQSYVVKGNRAAAQAFMADVENREKQYLLDARSYAADLSTLGMSMPTDVSNFYTMTITVSAAPPVFTLTATPIAGTKQESDGALTLDSSGAKTPADKW
ncbi:MAG: type IV pilin protein [Gallionella sp.]